MFSAILMKHYNTIPKHYITMFFTTLQCFCDIIKNTVMKYKNIIIERYNGRWLGALQVLGKKKVMLLKNFENKKHFSGKNQKDKIIFRVHPFFL